MSGVDNAVEERIEAWLDGRLDPERAARLHQELAELAVAEATVRAAGDIIALRSALRGESGVGFEPTASAPLTRADPTASRAPPPRRRIRRQNPTGTWIALAAAAAIVLGTLVWLSRTEGPRPTDPPADALTAAPGEEPAPTAPATTAALWSVVAADGATTDGGRLVRAADRLGADASLRADETGALRLSHLRAKIVLEASGPLDLRLKDDFIVHCTRGTLTASIDPRSIAAPFAVTTPHARCTVTGTRFEVRVNEAGTTLAVDKGQVVFQRLAEGTPVGGEQRIVAGETVSSTPLQPLIAYRLAEGPGALAGAGRLDRILPLTLERAPTWTDGGLLLTAENHCVTVANAPWPAFQEALVASQALTFSVRLRCESPPPPFLLVGELYIRPAPPAPQRLVQLRAIESEAGSWHRWSVTITPDGTARTYRGDRLLRTDIIAAWPPRAGDRSIQLKLLLPRGHHGDPDPDLAVTYADVLFFDRVLSPTELLALPGA